jgi:hypothetical protein
MLPHQVHNDEGLLDAMASETLEWMRFFAAPRMTAVRESRAAFWFGETITRKNKSPTLRGRARRMGHPKHLEAGFPAFA